MFQFLFPSKSSTTSESSKLVSIGGKAASWSDSAEGERSLLTGNTDNTESNNNYALNPLVGKILLKKKTAVKITPLAIRSETLANRPRHLSGVHIFHLLT